MRVLVLLLLAANLPAANLRYWIEPCTQPITGCHPGDPELAQWALEAWQQASSGHLIFENTTDRKKAHIRIISAGGQQGLYGEARPILVDGVQGAEVYVLPSADPSEKDAILRDAIVYLTCLHETGHALGLPHTAQFADIMYSFQYGGDIPEYFARYRRQLHSRTDIHQHPGLSPADRQKLLELRK